MPRCCSRSIAVIAAAPAAGSVPAQRGNAASARGPRAPRAGCRMSRRGTLLEEAFPGPAHNRRRMRMALEQYRRRRRFGVTPEPRGKAPRRRTKKLAFVVQKHRATALHYDFRLEWNGVMLSWAVPKGPSFNTKDKRMAMPTE